MRVKVAVMRTEALLEQLEFHWTNQLRPRLDGLTDDEYLWQPVPDCWTVHVRRAGAERPGNVPGGDIDFVYPEPQPPPFTTIAWRLAHIIVGVLAMRTHSHFDGPPADYQSWPYATDAATALRQLDDAYRGWHDGVRRLTDADLDRPCGPAEGPYAEYPMGTLVLHINREVIHHGAEIACIRDLYTHMKRN
jgi:hypothetical protein